MNPTPEHKEQAREIVEQWRFSVPRGQIGTVTDPQWDKLIDRIAAALSAKDAEIERLTLQLRDKVLELGGYEDQESAPGSHTRSSLAQKILNTVAAQEPPDSTLTLPRYEGYEQALKDVDTTLRDLFQKEVK